jgi:AraC-like DNA-binding protein
MNLSQLSDSLPVFLHALSEKNWSESQTRLRSAELTPFYVERYCQPRNNLLAPTAHVYWEFIYVFGGRGSFKTPTESIALGPGSAMLVPPGLEHAEYSGTLLDTLWVGLTGSHFRKVDPALRYMVEKTTLFQYSERLWLLAEQKQTGCGPEMDGLCRCIMSILTQHDATSQASRLTGIERAIEYIHANIAEPISVPTIAEDVGMSEGYFYRSFRRIVGVTPLEYLVNQRLKRATRLLHETTLSVNHIAQLVGYRDACYFRRLFKTRTGMTPSRYRHE